MESDRRFLMQIIAIYRKHPALWKIKSPINKNKALRDAGISELLRKFQQKYPEADRAFVRNKINNMRSVFKREFYKVRNSKQAASSPDALYVPSLWYYDLLLFTADDADDTKEGIDLLPDEFDEGNHTVSVTDDEPADSNLLSPTYFLNNSMPSTGRKKGSSLPKKKCNFIDAALDTLRNLSAEKEPIADDECTIIGKRVALQLRNMNEEQRLLAEKLTNDILFHGRRGKLTDTHITAHAQIFSDAHPPKSEKP